MGRAGKDDLHLRQTPLSALLHEAAEPHESRGINIGYHFAAKSTAELVQPSIMRKPEVLHGLRNLIQNAVDFANDQVWSEGEWTRDEISIRIADDGPGYPAHLIGRIGDPFMRHSKRGSNSSGNQRAGYEGMGLGLFIAKTLLERTGAELTFANGRDAFAGDTSQNMAFGAIVEVTWPRSMLDAAVLEGDAALGENQRIQH